MEISQDFYFVCNENELTDSVGRQFYLNDTEIAVFKVGSKIFAVSNICPHQHTSSIYDGIIENECVVCPLHGWTFNLKNGNLHSGSRGLDTYPVKIIDGKIFAKIKEKKFNW